MRRRLTALGVGALVGALVGLGTSWAAEDIQFAPVDRPGPALSVPQDKLDKSVVCTGDVAGSPNTPVLLLPPGGLSSKLYTWTFMPTFRAEGIPYCTLDIPLWGVDDMQDSAEYAVSAIRYVHGLRGGKISMMADSQSAVLGRWALRFWPDLRPMIDDYVGIVPTHHGVPQPLPFVVCGTNSLLNLKPLTNCVPAGFQWREGSNFIEAVDSYQETFPGISYTNVRSRLDLQGTLPTTALTGGGGDIADVLTQDVCPLDVSDHFLVGVSPAAHALTLDALRHPGPAVPSRIDKSVCYRPLLAPAIDPIPLPGNVLNLFVELGYNIATAPGSTNVEPPLRCYTLATGCP